VLHADNLIIRAGEMGGGEREKIKKEKKGGKGKKVGEKQGGKVGISPQRQIHLFDPLLLGAAIFFYYFWSSPGPPLGKNLKEMN